MTSRMASVKRRNAIICVAPRHHSDALAPARRAQQDCASMWWLTPGEKAHKQEFTDAWRQRHPGEPPMGTFKTWYRQWVLTKIPAGDWLDANTAAAPPGA